MNLFQQLFAWIAQLFGARPTQDGGASIPVSTVIYADKAQPGVLVQDASINYPNPLALQSFGLYGPDVSGNPNYPSSAVSGNVAGASWQDRLAAFLNSLGPDFSFTPATPLPPLGGSTSQTGLTVGMQDSGAGKTSAYTAPPTSILDVYSPPPPPPPPVIGSTGGSTGGPIATTQSPVIVRQPSGHFLGNF